MQSTMMALVRQCGCAQKTFNSAICRAVIGLTGFAMAVSPASALTGANSTLQQQFKNDNPVVEIVVRRGGAVRRTTVVGPRGNVASRTVVRRGAVVRPGVVRPGGAVDAGIAMGFSAAAMAVSGAGAAPAPGYCWR